tara:strand:- start:69 stop:377 length:309 start_codon:yes stop_codon:yes gene_type:complete
MEHKMELYYLKIEHIYIIIEANYNNYNNIYNINNNKNNIYLSFIDLYGDKIIKIKKMLDIFIINTTKHNRNKFGKKVGNVKKNLNYNKKLDYIKELIQKIYN